MRGTRWSNVARQVLAEVSDADLLGRYVRHQEEDAFAQIVARYSRLVWVQCRNLLPADADADDAFQATFLTLARSARKLPAGIPLGPWLHGVAYRVCQNARRAIARRTRRERACARPEAGQPVADSAWEAAFAVVAEEVQGLAAGQRAAFVLCCIEGRSTAEAAAILGVKPGALATGLSRAKQALLDRLARRGFGAGILALGLLTNGGTAPAELVRRALSLVAAGVAVPCSVQSLTHGVIGMTTTRFKLLAAAVLITTGLGLGVGGWYSAATTQPPGALPPASKSTKPAPLLDFFGDPLPHGAIARLGTTRFWQSSRDTTLSPDGKMIAMSMLAENGHYFFSLMDAVTGRMIREEEDVNTHSVGCYDTTSIFWRPDGRGVALAGDDPAERYLWEFTNPRDTPPRAKPRSRARGAPKHSEEGEISASALSPDGAWLAIARQSSVPEKRVVHIYPCTTGKSLSDLQAVRTLGPVPAGIEGAWFTAGGKELVLVCDDYSANSIDAASGKLLHRVMLPKWTVITASRDGKHVALVPWSNERDYWQMGEQKVRVWSLISGGEVWTLPRAGDVISGMEFTPDSKFLITSDEEFDYRRWDLTTGKEVASCKATNVHGDVPMSVVAVSADGKRHATSRDGNQIKLFNTENGKHLNPMTVPQEPVSGVAISPDSQTVATVEYNGMLRMWTTTSGKLLWSIPAAVQDPDYGNWCTPLRHTSFTPDGRSVVFDSEGVLAMAEAKTGKLLDLPGALKNRPGFVGGFSQDGKMLVTFSGDTATLWDWPTGTVHRTFRVSLTKDRKPDPSEKLVVPEIENVALSPDGGTLFTFSKQKPSYDLMNSNDCWDVKTGKLRSQYNDKQFDHIRYAALAFSPDGRTLHIGAQPTDRRDALASWDATAKTIVRRFDDPLYDTNLSPEDRSYRHVKALALSPDGRLLAVVEDGGKSDGNNAGWNQLSYRHELWIHETASGRVIRRLDGHHWGLCRLAFTPDGSKLVSVSEDKTGLVWDVSLPSFSDRKGGPLAPKELDNSWAQLAAPDPVPAWQAMADLAKSPAEAVPYLADRLKPLPKPTDADLDRIEQQLRADEFDDREKASAELNAYGPNAVSAVKQRIEKTDSPEVARRFAEFLKQNAGESASPVVLRGRRGVFVLEAIGTPEARKVLARIAGNHSGDPLEVDATDALGRLERRSSKK